MKISVFTLLFSFLVAVPAYAAASPSNADEQLQDEIPLINDLGSEVDDNANDSGLLGEILRHVKSLDDFFVSGDVATVSNADSVDPAQDDDLDQGETITFFNDAISLAASSEDRYVNVLRYDVVVDGHSYICCFSPEYIDSLYVDAQKRLWNVSTNVIQGRVVDATFDPYAETGILVYLTPCLGNNFSHIRNYGSPNYLRKYYWNGTRYQYTDTYCEIVVEKAYYPFSMSDMPYLILIFLVGGGVLICWLNRFRHY